MLFLHLYLLLCLFDTFFFCFLKLTKLFVPYQFLEEVTNTLMVAPVLNPGQQSVIEVLVDLMELWHFEENGLYLLNGQQWLGGCGCSPQRLHWLTNHQRQYAGHSYILTQISVSHLHLSSMYLRQAQPRSRISKAKT